MAPPDRNYNYSSEEHVKLTSLKQARLEIEIIWVESGKLEDRTPTTNGNSRRTRRDDISHYLHRLSCSAAQIDGDDPDLSQFFASRRQPEPL